MNKFLAIAFTLVTIPALAKAHTATVSWTASPDAQTGLTYSISRGTGACTPTVPTLTVLANGLTAVSYTDSTVVPGTYCYSVVAVMGGQTSTPLQGTGLIPVAPPTTIVIAGN
jgi:hypothetical protein